MDEYARKWDQMIRAFIGPDDAETQAKKRDTNPQFLSSLTWSLPPYIRDKTLARGESPKSFEQLRAIILRLDANFSKSPKSPSDICNKSLYHWRSKCPERRPSDGTRNKVKAEAKPRIRVRASSPQ